jgi:hypothetical protein
MRHWILDPTLALEEKITPRTMAVHLWNERIKHFKEGPPGRQLSRPAASGRGLGRILSGLRLQAELVAIRIAQPELAHAVARGFRALRLDSPGAQLGRRASTSGQAKNRPVSQMCRLP